MTAAETRPSKRRERQAPLLLLDEAGLVVWQQDESLSDEAPLDLGQCEAQIAALAAAGAK